VALSERLGQEGVRLQQLARGSISRTLVPVETPLIFEEAIELEYPLMLLEPLTFLLGRLLEQLCARLGARALATQELRLRPEPEKLELTLARITGIVGEGSVGSLEILDTHHPHGFRMRRFAPAEPQRLGPRSSEKPESNNSITALRIFRPPVRATVTLRHGKPSHIVCSKRIQGDILWAAGPWRSSGDWWEQEGWARD